MEEVEDEDADAHIRGGTTDNEMILEELVEEFFIRKTESEDTMPDLCQDPDEEEIDEEDDNEILVFQIENGKKVHYIASVTKPASWENKDLNPQAKDEKVKTMEEMVPRQFHEYLKVFLKKASERMLVRKPWDHAIEMKPGYEPKKAKNIPLSPQKQKEVEEFLNDQLGKGYIRES